MKKLHVMLQIYPSEIIFVGIRTVVTKYEQDLYNVINLIIFLRAKFIILRLSVDYFLIK